MTRVFHADNHLCFVELHLQLQSLIPVSVWRGIAWLIHKPGHLPFLCPKLVLNQLLLFLPLSECQRDPHFSFKCLLLGNPGGFRVLQRIAVLIQTLGFCRVSCFSFRSIVHIGAWAEIAISENRTLRHHLSHHFTGNVKALSTLGIEKSWVVFVNSCAWAVWCETIRFANENRQQASRIAGTLQTGFRPMSEAKWV